MSWVHIQNYRWEDTLVYSVPSHNDGGSIVWRMSSMPIQNYGMEDTISSHRSVALPLHKIMGMELCAPKNEDVDLHMADCEALLPSVLNIILESTQHAV